MANNSAANEMAADELNELKKEVDRLFNSAIVKGVLEDALSAWKNGRYRAAVVLTYSGIDTMASLVREPQSAQVQRSDFVQWVEKYMDFGGKDGPTGLEVYGARCGLLHANMAESQLSVSGKARMIAYMDNADKPFLIEKESPDLMLVSVRHLVRIFAEAVGKSWGEIKSDRNTLLLVRDRLQKVFAICNVNELGKPP